MRPDIDRAPDDSFELPTARQAEDAAANALGQLICQGVERHLGKLGAKFEEAV
jgi:hypothetical protein